MKNDREQLRAKRKYFQAVRELARRDARFERELHEKGEHDRALVFARAHASLCQSFGLPASFGMLDDQIARLQVTA